MTPIRPDPFSLPSGQSQRPDAGRTAAQKAFFDAAMGRANAPAPTAVAAPATPAFTPTTAPVQRVTRLPDPAAEAPAKVLRPGSLLDIRV